MEKKNISIDNPVDHRCVENFTEVNRPVVISELAAQTLILMRTKYSVYMILIVDPHEHEVIIQGGEYFQKPTCAVIHGATWGGSCIWTNIIFKKMRIEFGFRGQRRIVTTSKVDTIAVGTDSQISQWMQSWVYCDPYHSVN